jgi:hypothetical protein
MSQRPTVSTKAPKPSVRPTIWPVESRPLCAAASNTVPASPETDAAAWAASIMPSRMAKTTPAHQIVQDRRRDDHHAEVGLVDVQVHHGLGDDRQGRHGKRRREEQREDESVGAWLHPEPIGEIPSGNKAQREGDNRAQNAHNGGFATLAPDARKLHLNARHQHVKRDGQHREAFEKDVAAALGREQGMVQAGKNRSQDRLAQENARQDFAQNSRLPQPPRDLAEGPRS